MCETEMKWEEVTDARKDCKYYAKLQECMQWFQPWHFMGAIPWRNPSMYYNLRFLCGCVIVLHSPAPCMSRLTARRLVVAAVANGPDVTTIFFELPLEGFLFFRAFFFSWNSSKLRDGRASIFSSKLKSLKEWCSWKCGASALYSRATSYRDRDSLWLLSASLAKYWDSDTNQITTSS